jgi:urease subunit alpha
VAVGHCRDIGLADMVRNSRTGSVHVDPTGATVRLDGVPLVAEPVSSVPLSRLYLI